MLGFWCLGFPLCADDRGLILTFDSAGSTDSRVARLVSLYVPEGHPPTPFLTGGKFTATWLGDINLDLRDEFTFTAHGRGKLTVTLHDFIVLDISSDDFSKTPSKPYKLSKGKNQITVRYESPDKGDAWLRLYWSSSEFPSEPIHPTVFSHPSNSPSLQQSAQLRNGRELLAKHRCLKCHIPDNPNAIMAEFLADTPSFENVGGRLDQFWMSLWIANPHRLRSSAGMPRLLPTDQDAEDIASFLSMSRVRGDFAKGKFDKTATSAGGRLFGQLGCVGCHPLPDYKDKQGESSRISLNFIQNKYQPNTLADFLLQPDKHHTSAQMPNFNLSKSDIEQIVAFIFSHTILVNTVTNPKAMSDRGRELVQSTGCLNCHGGLKLENKFTAPKLAQVAKSDHKHGCLGVDDAARGKAPNYGFAAEQREALAAFLMTDLSSLTRESPIEFAERQIRLLNCVACHDRDDQVALRVKLADEVKDLLPERPENQEEHVEFTAGEVIPSLTWAGEKLRPEWMAAYIAGKVSYRVRPWVLARMPAFPAGYADGIAQGLAMEHGFPPKSVPEPVADPNLSEIGKKLAGREAGLACVTCHDISAAKAVAPFEAPAPNFAHIKGRIRPEYFQRWMRNPVRVWPGTKMPKFANDEGLTPLTDILDGNAEKQFEAIWNYLQAGEKIEAP